MKLWRREEKASKVSPESPASRFRAVQNTIQPVQDMVWCPGCQDRVCKCGGMRKRHFCGKGNIAITILTY